MGTKRRAELPELVKNQKDSRTFFSMERLFFCELIFQCQNNSKENYHGKNDKFHTNHLPS